MSVNVIQEQEARIVRVAAPAQPAPVVVSADGSCINVFPGGESHIVVDSEEHGAVIIGSPCNNEIIVIPDQGPPGVPGPPGPPGPSGPEYELPVASATTLGGIKVGAGLSIDAEGVLSAIGGGGGDGGNLGQRVKAEFAEPIDGISTAFHLTANALNAFDMILSVGGVIQQPGDDFAFTAPNIVSFVEPPPAGSIAWALILG